MDTDFSFVLVSSLQPASSSKRNKKIRNALTENKLIFEKQQSHSVPAKLGQGNNRKSTRNSAKKEWTKENNLNISNQQNSYEMKGKANKSKNLRSSVENGSLEFPDLTDLKNVCIRKRQPQKQFIERKDSTKSYNEIFKMYSSSEEIERDPYSMSFSDDCYSEICNRKSSKNTKKICSKRASKSNNISSNLTKSSTSSLKISNNVLKRRSSDRLRNLVVNSIHSDPIQKQKLQIFRSSNEIDNINFNSSSEQIEKDPYSMSFNDTNQSCSHKLSKKNTKKLASKNNTINSNSTKNSTSSLETSNIFKRRFSNSDSRLVNSFDNDIKIPRLRGGKVIQETLESDASDLYRKLRKTSSSAVSTRVSSNSRVSGVDSLSEVENCDFKKLIANDENLKEKIRSSDPADVEVPDGSVIESSLVSTKPKRQKIKNEFTLCCDINKSPNNEEISVQTLTNKKLSDSSLTLKERKFFKGIKKSTKKISFGSFFKTRRSSLLDPFIPLVADDNIDLVSSDDSVVEPTIITPKKARKKQMKNEPPILREINKKTQLNDKKENTGPVKTLRKISKGSTNENVNTVNKKKPKFLKGNDKVGTKKTNSGKPKLTKSITNLVTPPLSPDKLININNWLQETSKHINSRVVVNSAPTESLDSFHGLDNKLSVNKLEDQAKQDENEMSCSSSSSVVSESVGISENILNQLYGTVWQKQRSEVLPQSEPRRGRKKTPRTEKKQRMSIYDVFSSSSSEDRFEQFLESVGKTKINRKHSVKKTRSTLDFIHDSSSENDTSLTMYHFHIANDVKSDAGSVLKNKLDLTTFQQTKKTGKQRRLSFTSSTDSEIKSVKTRTKPKNKDTVKKDGVKPRTKDSNKSIGKDSEINFILSDNDMDNILKPKDCTLPIENILKPKRKERKKSKENDFLLKKPTKSIENILKPKTPTKSVGKTLKKKVIGNEDSGEVIKINPKDDTKSVTGPSKKKNLREINVNDNKIQFNSSFVIANLTPFKKTNNNSDKKSKENEKFKIPNPIDIVNTPAPTPRKKVGVYDSPGLTLSFLSSLSEITGNLKCHPEALIYKKNFKKKKEELAKKLFNLYNKEIFDLKLPSDMPLQWNSRMRSTSGYCYNKRSIMAKGEILRSSRIALSTKILDRPARLRDTLVHELCHAATWLINGMSNGHGSHWRAWADKASRRFPELPRITRCHDYSIQTKYTYKCMSCGYSIGRHSKSLDVKRKRCGYCYGTFEVFLTSKVQYDLAPSESDSAKIPRTPSAFAMFVKENYGKVKKENGKLPHGDVMKLLGQQFAAVKLSKV